MRTVHSVDGVLARPGESVQNVLDRQKYGEDGAFFGAIALVNDLIAKDMARKPGTLMNPELLFESQRLMGGILEKFSKKDFDGIRKDIETFSKVGFNVGISDDNNVLYLKDLGVERISWGPRKA